MKHVYHLLILAAFAGGFTGASGQTGNVGIGTTAPNYSLDIHSGGNSQFSLTEGTGGRTALFSRYTNRLEIQPSDAFQISVGGIAAPHFWIGSNGFVGIGTTTPSTTLDVANGYIQVENANSYVITNSTSTNNFCGVNMRVQGNPMAWMYWDDANAVLNLNTAPGGVRNDLTVNQAGNIGIGTNTPADKLTITGGYVREESVNPFFFTNATTAGVNGGFSMRVLNNPKAWMYWNDNAAVMLLSTDPAGARNDLTINSTGLIGVGVTNPLAQMEVSNGPVYTENPSWTTYGNGAFRSSGASFHADGDILAQAFVAYSDARIKNIRGRSNPADDLKTLNRIEITDYSMKDTLMYGRRMYKKVIAQQLETVYPQLVTRGTNYIPNIYARTSRIERRPEGYLLSFDHPLHVDPAAKRIELIDGNGVHQRVEVKEQVAPSQILVAAQNIPGRSVFVYGEQVDDFRTVDYDGLTTLAISATQALTKMVGQQQEQIHSQEERLDIQAKQIEALVNEVKALKTSYRRLN